MNRERFNKLAKTAAVKSLTASGRVLIGFLEFFDDMSFMRSHQSLCLSMDVSQTRAYLADTAAFHKKHRRAFDRVKSKKWIEDKNIGGLVIQTLTDNGEIAAIESWLTFRSVTLPVGEHVMVVFDIPEAAHAARDRFRNLLKRIGFAYHQRSVWCIGKEVAGGVRRIVEILKIERWVRVYRSREYL